VKINYFKEVCFALSVVSGLCSLPPGGSALQGGHAYRGAVHSKVCPHISLVFCLVLF